MQLQGAKPIECAHIINQHGGIASTEEITNYTAASHKNIFNYTFIAFVDVSLKIKESKQLMGIEH